MQYHAKVTLLTLSIASIVITLVVGQMSPVLAQSVPTSSNLVKRDYTYNDDLHFPGSGNTRVCGDHICAPGEWTQLQASLNHAQISHPSTNSTKTTPSLPPSIPATTPTTNSTVPASFNSTKPVISSPAPVSNPPSASPSVCVAVKAALANSTVSADTVAKIMSDLGCNN